MQDVVVGVESGKEYTGKSPGGELVETVGFVYRYREGRSAPGRKQKDGNGSKPQNDYLPFSRNFPVLASTKTE